MKLRGVWLGFSLLLALPATWAAEADYEVSAPITVLTGNDRLYYSQARAAIIPAEPARFLLTAQETEVRGTHSYRDLWMTESHDGVAWIPPLRLPTLTRRSYPDGFERVMGDVTPKWHARSKTVLATGKTFSFRGGKTEDRSREQVAYATFDPATNQWSELASLELPKLDYSGAAIVAPNSGCVQRFDLPDGDILLPIRYRRTRPDAPYVTLVARCSFDGTLLVYREHGSELVGPDHVPLYEPSLTRFKSQYFLTLRSDRAAYVAKSGDGLNYQPVTEWKFDDGRPVGSYNTQQHWVTHGARIYLVYTRRGANNDHVFRHRAPLFMAEVDPGRLCLLRATECVVMPEAGVDLGNFGVANVSPSETWIVTSEMGSVPGKPEARRVLIAKLRWKKPNSLFPEN